MRGYSEVAFPSLGTSQQLYQSPAACLPPSYPHTCLPALFQLPVLTPSFCHAFPFSCGLWQLFHSLAARLDAGEGGAALAALDGFVDVGFQCDECRRHFLEASAAPDAVAVATRRDAVLWLWGMHNRVSARLRGSPRRLHARVLCWSLRARYCTWVLS